jgi:hypothetical protein
MHNDVPRAYLLRLPTPSSGVCRCGAVFDYGNVSTPIETRGLCGRCAHNFEKKRGEK